MFKIISDKNRYLKSYKNFLISPEKELLHFAKNIVFCGDIASTWINDIYEIFEHNKHNKHFSVTLRSNGSTSGIPQKYNYSYNVFIIRDYIWKYMHRFLLNKNVLDQSLNRYWIESCHNYNNNRILSKKNCEGLILFLNPRKLDNKLSRQTNNSFWILSPRVANIICQHENVLSFLNENNIKLSITSCDSSFYNFSILDDMNIKWTNQMRSWHEGTTFYTCPYGEKHWMENLFFCTKEKKIIDLLNVHNTWWENDNCNPDNIWPLQEEFIKCKCGTLYRPMNFRPHYCKSFRDHNGKKADYQNPKFDFIKDFEYFQVIQQKNTNHFFIHSDKKVNNNILDNVNSFICTFYKKQFKIYFHHYIYLIGNKSPIFWSEYDL